MREELAKFKAEQDRYLSELGKVEETVSAYKGELELKHSEFVNKLESTNIDQIYKLTQDTKDSMNKKFTFLFAGISVIFVLMIVSFFI
jgi:lysine/ornithine N-monooxygenase